MRGTEETKVTQKEKRRSTTMVLKIIPFIT